MADDGLFDWLNLKTLLIFIVALVIIIAASFASYKIFFPTQEPIAYSGERVEQGDQVSVDYIGMFEDGRVFDTSIEEVATDNALYPKSHSFEDKETYSPLSYTVGEGQMSGFDNGVVGMAVNQTRVLTIPPEDGYGFPDESKIKTIPMMQTFPVYEWLSNSTDFSDTYFVEPVVGTTVKSMEYGWNMSVYHVDPITAEILAKHEPNLNEVIQLWEGWSSKVISIDSSANGGEGLITVKHLLTSEDAGQIYSTDQFGAEFRVVNVDTSAKTITLDYNREVVGQTLIFQVTVLSIGA
jgi:FKBP-type peptidyl-prolyl cis-trans isomerase 2